MHHCLALAARARRLGDDALGGEGVACDFVGDAVGRGVQRPHDAHAADAHHVGGESARLVAADDGGATEGLHRRERAHDGVALGHLLGAQRQARGHHRGEALGNGRHRERHRNLEVVHGAAQDASMRGVGEVADVHNPHQDANHRNDLSKEGAKLVQLLLQRSHLLRGLGHGRVDLADGGLNPARRHHCARAPHRHHRPGEQHGRLVLVHRVDRGARLYVLEHAVRLAGEDGLVATQLGGEDLHDARVAGHLGTHRHLHHVPGHKLARRNHLEAPAAQHRRQVRLQRLQLLNRLLRVGLRHNPNRGVGHEDEHDDQRLDKRSAALSVKHGQEEGDDGGGNQDLDQQVVKLLEHELPEGHALVRRHFVPAKLELP
mmetsp:Transcript_35412/g.67768  ORF Transcript_35412/g.67768 Transcript_35412/m.67768 type:complete len:374 (-) Transcript_35412:249-1370(-)